MANSIDLHMHSTYSDGSLSPEELVDQCVKANLTHISITDHDTAGSYLPAKKHSDKIGGPEIIPGIEFSANLKGNDIHILAYYIPFDDENLNRLMQKAIECNLHRITMVTKKLNQLGFPIHIDDIKPNFDSGVRMGPQFLRPLRDAGVISDENDGEAFLRKHLSYGADAYVPNLLKPEEILNICRSAGAVTSIAHPHKIREFSIVQDLIDMGVMGIEYYYPNVPKDKKAKLYELAMKHDLILTGGSDYHGRYSNTELGDGSVPFEVYKLIALFA